MMGLSTTFSLYLVRHFLAGMGIVLALLALVMFTAELVEHLRRAGNNEGVGFGLVMQMTLYKLPTVISGLWPFIALFGAMLALSRLVRSSELVVARAAGVSVWQFLGPLVMTALLLGLFLITAVNPLTAALSNSYDQLFNRHFKGQTSLISVSHHTGLWLREVIDGDAQVVHALSVSGSGARLRDATFFTLEEGTRFKRRIDAGEALLDQNVWRLKDVVITAPDEPVVRRESMTQPTNLTLNQIVGSLARPETLSFWQLPGFIDLLKASGFNGLEHRLYWHSLLALPLLLAAMVLLAATFCLRISNRKGGMGWVFFAGALAGFAIYFVTDVVEAFGAAGKLPIVLAAWTPAAVTGMCAMALMFHLEDG